MSGVAQCICCSVCLLVLVVVTFLILSFSSLPVNTYGLDYSPITKRISEKKNFSLELLKDDVGEVEIQDQRFIDSLAKEFKVREVLLYGDKIPLVFARTIIPLLTIEKGLAELGKLGTRPLGDILF